jgi:hypothetical protein
MIRRFAAWIKELFRRRNLRKEAKAQAIKEAINRELRAGTKREDIYLGQDARVRTQANPEGVLVANRKDEPFGAQEGVSRVIAEGKDPKRHGGGVVPNFAGAGSPPLFSRATMQSLGSGARNLAEAAVGADRMNKALGAAGKAGTALKVAFADMLSPLGLAAGFALTFSVGLYKAVMDSRLLQAALERVAQVQVYSVQFEKLLGGMRQAKQRLNELASMAASGPFKFDDLVQANERLQRLSRGGFAGKKAMQMVADAAAATGVSTAQMAGMVGGAFDDAFSGRLIEGAVNQLRDVGAISMSAADKLINLERAGVRGKKLFDELTRSLAANKGAAAALRNTIAGLNNELEQAKGQQLGSIGEMFAQGQMDGLRASIKLVKEFGPVLKELLMPFAVVANAIGKMTLGVSKLVSNIPGLKSALVGVAQAAGTAAVALAALGLFQLAVAIRALVLPLLAKLVTGLVASAAAGGIVGRALGFVAGGLLRFLGPIGLVLAALDLMGVKFENVARSAGLLPDSVTEAAEASRKASQDIREALDGLRAGGGGTAGEGIEILGAAEENFRRAEKARKEAAGQRPSETREAVGGMAATVLGAPVDALAGIVNAGAQMMGMASPFKTSVDQSGTIDPIGGSEMLREFFTGSQGQAQREQEAAAAAEEAKRLRDEARAQLDQTPAQFLNDPDFAAAKSEALDIMDRANEAQDRLNEAEMPDEQRAQQQQKIDAMRSEAEAKMAPEAMEERFDRRMARDDVKASITRAMADGTGNEQLRLQANELEDRVKTERRAKEFQSMGIERPEAMEMARAQTVSERLQSEQERAQAMTFSSGLGKVGGAAGEMGGGKSEEARLLTEIRNLMERDTNGKPPPPMPETMKKMQR